MPYYAVMQVTRIAVDKVYIIATPCVVHELDKVGDHLQIQ